MSTRENSKQEMIQQVRILDRSYVVSIEDVEPLRALLPSDTFAVITDPYPGSLISSGTRAAWDYAHLVNKLFSNHN